MNELILFILMQLAVQTPQYEIQVPFDSAGKIYEINRDLAAVISFFESYSDMDRAILFLEPDSSYIIELYYRKDALTMKQRIQLSPQDLLEIQDEVVQLRTEKKIKALRNRSGAWLYIINTFIFSYIGRTPLLIAATQPSDPRVATTIYLLSSTAGFFIPLLVTKNTDITYSHAFLSWYGTTRGAYAGFVINSLINDHYDYDSGDNWFPLVGSIIGEISGFKAASSYGVGEAGMITTMGDWGTVCLPGLIAIAEDYESQKIDDRVYWTSSLGGLTAGVLSGHYMSKKLDLHEGDPRIFRLYGLFGAATPPTILSWFEIDKPNLYIASALIGCGIGSYLGWKVIKNNNYTFGDGVILEIGSVAGGMMTSGFLLLADIWTDTDFSPQVYATTALAGTMLGVAFTSKQIRAGSTKRYGGLLLHPEGFGYIALAQAHNIPCKVPIISFSF